MTSPFLPPQDFENGSFAVVGLQRGTSAVSYGCHQSNVAEGDSFHYVP